MIPLPFFLSNLCLAIECSHSTVSESKTCSILNGLRFLCAEDNEVKREFYKAHLHTIEKSYTDGLLLFLIFLYNTRMLFAVFIIINSNEQNVTGICKKRIWIFFLLNLLHSCLCAFFPLQFYHQCRVKISVLRLREIDKICEATASPSMSSVASNSSDDSLSNSFNSFHPLSFVT